MSYESSAYIKGISFELTTALKVSRKREFQIAELRAVVLAIANTLRCSTLVVRYNCTSAWVTRVRDMSERALSREMHFFAQPHGLTAARASVPKLSHFVVYINYACNISRLLRVGFFSEALCDCFKAHCSCEKRQRFVCPHPSRGSFFQLYALKRISIKFRSSCLSIRHLYPFLPREASCGGVS